MAPRTAKAKKVAEVKSSVSDAPKNRRGKAKNEPQEDEKTEVVEKKTNRRGKKIESYDEELNGGDEISEPPAKKGRGKKNAASIDDKPDKIDDKSAKESGTPAEENDGNGDANGHSEDEITAPAKGRKKATKKETVTKPIETSKPKAKQGSVEPEDKDEEDKPRGRGRGRRAEPKPESDEVESESVEQPAKGRKKAPTKNDKDAAKAAKDEEKAAKAAAKDAEKAAKDAEKAAKAAVKEAEKASKLAAKEAEKAAKIAAKDAEKAAKLLVAKETEKATDKETEENESSEETAEPDADNSNDKDSEAKANAEPKKGRKGKGKPKEENNDLKEEKESESEKGDSKEDQDMEVDDTKPVKSKRGQKKVVEKTEVEEESPDTGEPNTKRKRKTPEDKGGDTKKKVNKSSTQYEDIDFSSSSKNSLGKEWNFKISCWNVDGIRAWLGKGGLEYINYEKPDILCLQEIKCSRDKLPEEVANVPGYHAYWLCSDKEGYAGVGIYTTKLAMNVQYGLENEEFDDEGRIITAEYEQFYLICTYVPNAGRKLVTLDKRLKWNEAFRKHVKSLDEKKPVIICGDMNVSHKEIDLTNPKNNKRNAGFTDEERAGMTELLSDGFVDTYRHLNPDKASSYTFWSYMFNSRAKNVGWRLDYFIMSERLASALCDSVIRDKVYGSDHCPITLFLHLSSADKPKE
ncbi:recombination repair protein 1-like [Pieris napi]|uniref:recombination repair protein 1-like n=1 Tax=Pieris napi TaxID=78633 RepID=UPI001FBA8568|nr:recombination repair protein 1-like [Pieris napi]